MLRIGRGSKISIGRKVGAATTYTYTQLRNVTGITPPAVTFDEVEVSSMDDTNDDGSISYMRRYIPGLGDVSDCELEVRYDPESATDNLLSEILTSRETVAIKIEIIGTTEPTIFAGYCKAYALEVTDGEAMNKNPTFRCNRQIEA